MGRRGGDIDPRVVCMGRGGGEGRGEEQICYDGVEGGEGKGGEGGFMMWNGKERNRSCPSWRVVQIN